MIVIKAASGLFKRYLVTRKLAIIMEICNIEEENKSAKCRNMLQVNICWLIPELVDCAFLTHDIYARRIESEPDSLLISSIATRFVPLRRSVWTCSWLLSRAIKNINPINCSARVRNLITQLSL